jgi:2-iminoacetate synthase ThiH
LFYRRGDKLNLANNAFKLKLDPEIESISYKTIERKDLEREEAIKLMNLKVNSYEMFAIMVVANWRSRLLFSNLGEVHAQIGINYAQCSKKCKFCTFG